MNNKSNRYIAIYHKWHVDSKGFEIQEINDCDTKQQAREKASLKSHSINNQSCISCDFEIIELSDNEFVTKEITTRSNEFLIFVMVSFLIGLVIGWQI